MPNAPRGSFSNSPGDFGQALAGELAKALEIEPKELLGFIQNKVPNIKEKLKKILF